VRCEILLSRYLVGQGGGAFRVAPTQLAARSLRPPPQARQSLLETATRG
jgi:hypothetical protein